MVERSPEIKHITLDDAHQFLDCIEVFEMAKSELQVLFRYYRSKEKEEENKTNKEIANSNFNKIESEPIKESTTNKNGEIKSNSNFTKASSRGSLFKSLTGSEVKRRK